MYILRPDVALHIQKCYEEELKNPPIPRKYGDIPVSYEIITAEWLRAILSRDQSGTVVKDFRLGANDDGTSNRRAIYLEWEGPAAESLPTAVFCKAAQGVSNRLLLANGGSYSEVTFYNRVRHKVEIEAPTAYFAAFDPESFRAMVVLPNMAAHTTFCDRQTLLSKEQFTEQFQILAKLHGSFYESKEDFFSELLGTQQRFENMRTLFDVKAVGDKGFRAAQSLITPRLFVRKDELWPLTLKSMARNASLPPTVVHGDVHLGNWYITSAGRMGLSDWQAMSRGHWSRDIAYVLGTAVPTDKRRLWEHDAIRHYIAELAKAGGPTVSETEAWLELRRSTFGPLYYWTCTLTPSANMPDMQTEATSKDFVQRIAALMDDHDALDSFN